MFFSMGSNDTRGTANLYPRGMIGRIYVGYHLALLHTKFIQTIGLVVSEEIFFMFFSDYKPMADNDSPKAWPIWTQGAW